VFKHFVPIVYGVTNAFFSAAEGVAVSSAGMFALSFLGYQDFNPQVIREQLVLGNSLAGGVTGFYSRSLLGCGFFRSDYQNEISGGKKIFLSSAYVGLKILSGMFGQLMEKVFSGKLRKEDELFNIVALGAIMIIVPMWGVDRYFYRNFAPVLKRVTEFCDRVYRIHEFDDVEEEDDEEYVHHITYSPKVGGVVMFEHFDGSEDGVGKKAFSI
jgi:hypothetical protein